MKGKTYSFERSILPQKVPLDMWKVVLRTLSIELCHKVEKIYPKAEKIYETITSSQKFFSSKTSSQTIENNFSNPAENLYQKLENFPSGLEKNCVFFLKKDAFGRQ